MPRHENPYPPPEPTRGDTEAPPPAGDSEAVEEPKRPRWLPRRRTHPDPPKAETAAPAETDPGASGPETDPQAGASDTDDEPTPTPATETNPGRLRRRRKRLITDREVAVYHLGGLAFELYRRDMLVEDVMRRRAGTIAVIDEAIHDIDVRLEQIDSDRRERRGHRAGQGPSTVGNCLACRAPFQADARFCWQCGARLIPTDPSTDEQVTQSIRTAQA